MNEPFFFGYGSLVNRATHVFDATHPVLLSYIDVVVQGFLWEFGEAGVERFFDSTDGWAAPILNDRAEPVYLRAQRLEPHETELANHHLTRVGATLTDGA